MNEFTLKSLNIPAKLSVTFFLGSVFIAVISALILLGLVLSQESSGFVIPSFDGIKLKYGTPEIVSSMKTTMYQHVTEDESIVAVEQWIIEGSKKEDFKEKVLPIMKEDCTNCHSKKSTMSQAMTSMPLGKYKEVLPLTKAGYSWKKMSKQAHIHLFGITVFLIILSLLMAYSSFLPWIKYLFIIVSSLSLWIDIFSWWLTKFFVEFIYVIFLSGGLMSGSIIVMSVLVFLDLWISVPWISKKD